jgi:protein SCO1/2
MWKIVTGDAGRVKNLVGGGFEVYYDAANVQPDGTFAFEPDFILVDGSGILRARYRTETLDPETAARHFELVAREVRDSDGPARLAYEAAHLFVCYAD